MAFAVALFDAQAREYRRYHAEEVLRGDLLKAELGPEITRRTKTYWTGWANKVDSALQNYLKPEQYSAYAVAAGQPDSEDQKLIQQFTTRLRDTVAHRIKAWRDSRAARNPDSSPTLVNQTNVTNVENQQCWSSKIISGEEIPR